MVSVTRSWGRKIKVWMWRMAKAVGSRYFLRDDLERILACGGKGKVQIGGGNAGVSRDVSPVWRMMDGG